MYLVIEPTIHHINNFDTVVEDEQDGFADEFGILKNPRSFHYVDVVGFGWLSYNPAKKVAYISCHENQIENKIKLLNEAGIKFSIH